MTTENKEKTEGMKRSLANLIPYKPGQCGNPGGRPKDTLKQYIAKKLIEMSPEEKEVFLRGIPKEVQWKMGEGNPPQVNEHSGLNGEPITFKWED